jgi:hypothetical protein
VAHPASYPMGSGGSFPGGKARPGRDADQSTPSNAEVKNEQELYLLFAHAPPWRVVAGSLYLFYADTEHACVSLNLCMKYDLFPPYSIKNV